MYIFLQTEYSLVCYCFLYYDADGEEIRIYRFVMNLSQRLFVFVMCESLTMYGNVDIWRDLYQIGTFDM